MQTLRQAPSSRHVITSDDSLLIYSELFSFSPDAQIADLLEAQRLGTFEVVQPFYLKQSKWYNGEFLVCMLDEAGKTNPQDNNMHYFTENVDSIKPNKDFP